MKRLLSIILLSVLLVACGEQASQIAMEPGGGITGTGNGSPGTGATIYATAQKGPLVQDSTLRVYEVSRGRIPQLISESRAISNQGEFFFQVDLICDPSQASEERVFSLEAEGRFYNEVTGTFSTESVILKALVTVTTPEQCFIEENRINLLTTLAHDRAIELFQNGQTAAESIAQAEQEVEALLVPVSGVRDIDAPFGRLRLDPLPSEESESNPEQTQAVRNDEHAWLFYLSALLLETEDENGGQAASLDKILSSLKTSVGDGSPIDQELHAAIEDSYSGLNAVTVEQNLSAIFQGRSVADLDLVLNHVNIETVQPTAFSSRSVTDGGETLRQFYFDGSNYTADGPVGVQSPPRGISYKLELSQAQDFGDGIVLAPNSNFAEISESALSSGVWYARVRREAVNGQLSSWAEVEFFVP